MKAVAFFFLMLFSRLSYGATELQLYWLSTCPHCHEQIEDVKRLQNLYPELQTSIFQLDGNENHVEQLRNLSKVYQIPFGSVPVSFVGNRAWVGFSQQTSIEIENEIKECLSKDLDCRINTGSLAPKKDFKIQIPIIGEYDLSKSSLIFSTILIALIDGFNPCSLWVLSLLMTMIVGQKSRKKIFIIGFSFLLTTAVVYGVFMAGIVSSLMYLNHLFWIKIAVASMALLFAVVNIKDYFGYKKGISFTIPKKFQPAIYRNLRQLAHSEQSILVLIGFTILIAGGIAIVEFPCTAGFPIIWGQLILQSNVVGAQYFSLLMLYILFYLIDELLIFFVIVTTLKVSQLQEKHGRFLKLVSGMIMLGMSIALVFFPQIMENILTSFSLVLIAVTASFIIHTFYQRLVSRQSK